ncbi:ABC transporter substrate-binding protein [Chelatococcus asaccharovorans]|uniref:ABC transporter substrate-binding protein n=1 Tax=Chelatococcus asaccharovorans TaxID=28210 RepID=UPI00224C6565|nr:extracellular solute-binding protein [Chelatococcus asaccharovorans]CAH1652758.1 Multiple sugar transport system substrate-binding protein [Chelatococcus asaccharovorans]CAH1693723.1 Multiple sugar transport system substrate-binding protein [Chelatococcus asaccharovorans]
MMRTESQRAPLRGITWGHRRAIDPLVAASRVFAEDNAGRTVDWAVRDLSAFEHQPLAEAIRDCDLLVFDHPFVGEIAGSGLFLPLDDVLARVPGGAAEETYAGPSLRSYRWQGKVWGAPVDAATMNAVFRPDLLNQLDCPVPQDWDEVIALGRAARRQGLWLGLANGDHHSFLAAGTLMHNLGARWTATPEGGLVFDLDVFARALDALDEVNGYAHPDSGHFNSIALHDAMASRDDLVYCPLTYGYATYGEADFGRRRLGFGPFPGPREPRCAGTLVGGAAVGITAHCPDPDAAKAYVAFLLQRNTQDGIFARHHGQPATTSAWHDDAIDAAFNGYFASVRETLEPAAVRPRFKGFGRFEKEAGRHVGSYLRKETTRSALLRAMRELVDVTQAQATT